MELHDFLIVFHWWKNNILTSKFQLRTLFSTSDNQCKYVRIAIFSDFWAMYTFISDDSGSAKYRKLGINPWSRLSATWPKIVFSRYIFCHIWWFLEVLWLLLLIFKAKVFLEMEKKIFAPKIKTPYFGNQDPSLIMQQTK